MTELSTTSQDGGVYYEEGEGEGKEFDSMLDVGKLLESLQQLNKTQDQLQASADKLRSMPPGKADSVSPQPGTTPLATEVVKPVLTSAGAVHTDRRWRNVADGGRPLETVDLSLSFASSLPEGAGPPLHAGSSTRPAEPSSTQQTSPPQGGQTVVGPTVPTSVVSIPTIPTPSTSAGRPVRVSPGAGGLVRPSTTAPVGPGHVFDQFLFERRLSAHGGKGKVEGRKNDDATWFALSSHLL